MDCCAGCGREPPPWAAPPPLTCLTEPFTINLSGSTVLHSNLGGHGPDSGEPNLRYGAAGYLDGAPFDLLVEVAEGHEYLDPHEDENGHGASGGFAKINLAFGSSTKLRFSFVWPDTTDEVPLQQVKFNIYDFDTTIPVVNEGVLTFNATIAGTVDDFDRVAYATKLAKVLDTPVENVTLLIMPGSVYVEALIAVDDAAKGMATRTRSPAVQSRTRWQAATTTPSAVRRRPRCSTFRLSLSWSPRSHPRAATT